MEERARRRSSKHCSSRPVPSHAWGPWKTAIPFPTTIPMSSGAGSPFRSPWRRSSGRASRSTRWMRPGPMAEESEWPDDIHAMADPAREKLMEAVAESDDALIEEYLEQGTLPEEHIVNGAKAGFAAARLAPVLVGSASRAIGIDRLLDFIVDEFPSPLDRGPITVIGKGGETK